MFLYVLPPIFSVSLYWNQTGKGSWDCVGLCPLYSILAMFIWFTFLII